MLSRQSYSFLLQVGNITTELCYGLIKVSHLNTTIVVDFPLLAAPASRGLAKFSLFSFDISRGPPFSILDPRAYDRLASGWIPWRLDFKVRGESGDENGHFPSLFSRQQMEHRKNGPSHRP